MLDIKFSLSGSTADKDVLHQARAVVATLHHLFGHAVLPQPQPSFANEIISDPTVISTLAPVPAPDGYPTPAEPTAADAFGATDDDDGAPATDVDPGQRDKNGLPWDERIHASTKAMNADGTWRNRRNLDKAILASVTAELEKANTARTMEAATGLVPPPPPPAGATPPPPPPPASAPAATAPAPSPVPVVPGASSTAPAVSFPAIMIKITAAQRENKITPEAVKNLQRSLGMKGESIAELNANPDLLPAFAALLDDHLATAG